MQPVFQRCCPILSRVGFEAAEEELAHEQKNKPREQGLTLRFWCPQGGGGTGEGRIFAGRNLCPAMPPGGTELLWLGSHHCVCVTATQLCHPAHLLWSLTTTKTQRPWKDFAFCSQEEKGETLDGALGNLRYLFIAGLGIQWPLNLPSNPNIL